MMTILMILAGGVVWCVGSAVGGGGGYEQGLVHLVECLFGLVEESRDNRATKLVASIVVHLADLLKGRDINDFGNLVDLGRMISIDAGAEGGVWRGVAGMRAEDESGR